MRATTWTIYFIWCQILDHIYDNFVLIMFRFSGKCKKCIELDIFNDFEEKGL